jgi:ankyrin repeat protein
MKNNNKRKYKMANGKLLSKAAEEGNLKTVKFLVENGANIHCNNEAPLHYAVKNGHLKTVKYLVEQGADIHARNDYAVRWAARKGHFEIVKYLVENGADIYARNELALSWAVTNNHFRIANYLKSIAEKYKQNQIDTQIISIDKNIKKLIINFEEQNKR